MQGSVRGIFFVFMALLVWAPIPFGSNRVWAWTLLEFILFSLLLVLIFIKTIGLRGIPQGVKNAKWILGLLLAWALLPVLQIVPLPVELVQQLSPSTLDIKLLSHSAELVELLPISIDVERSVEEVAKNLAYFAAFLITIYCCYSIERQRTLLITIAIVATLIALSVITKIALDVVLSGQVQLGTGSFINKNHFAAFINMGIAAAVGIILSAGLAEKRDENRASFSTLTLARAMDWRWHMVVYLAVLITTLMLTMSRGAWISLILAMLIVLGFIRSSQHNREWHFSTYYMLVVVVGVTMLLSGGDILVQRITDLADDAIGRQIIWSNTLEIIKDYPLFGVGAGNFQYIYPLYDNGGVTEYVDYVHNDYLQLLVEQGPISVLLAGLIVYICLSQAVKGIRQNDSMARSAFAAASLLACSVILIHGLVEFNFHIPSNSLYFFVFLAMAYISGMPAHIEVKRKRKKRAGDRLKKRATGGPVAA